MTKDAEKLLARLYKRYKADVDSGKPRSQAKFLGDARKVHELDWPEISTEDVSELVWELDAYQYLNAVPGDDLFMEAELTQLAIEYMENRLKNTLLGITEFISKFLP